MTKISDIVDVFYKSLFSLKGFIADLNGGGFVHKYINYPISMLPIVFRSVDCIVNDH